MNQTPTAPRREIPAPEAILAELHRALTEMEDRIAGRTASVPADDARPILVIMDEAQDFARFPADAQWRAQAAAIHTKGRAANVTGPFAATCAPERRRIARRAQQRHPGDTGEQ